MQVAALQKLEFSGVRWLGHEGLKGVWAKGCRVWNYNAGSKVASRNVPNLCADALSDAMHGS